jgi:hypothetical protein
MKKALEKLLLILLMPVTLIIQLTWIVGGIWLATDSAWNIIGWGLLIGFIAPFILSLVLIPSLLLVVPSFKLIEKGWKIIGFILIGLAALFNSFAFTMYFYYVMAEFLPYAKQTHPIAILLWSIGVAVGGLNYMANRERSAGGSSSGSGLLIMFSTLGFISSLASIYFLRTPPINVLLISMGIIFFGSLISLLISLEAQKTSQ